MPTLTIDNQTNFDSKQSRWMRIIDFLKTRINLSSPTETFLRDSPHFYFLFTNRESTVSDMKLYVPALSDDEELIIQLLSASRNFERFPSFTYLERRELLKAEKMLSKFDTHSQCCNLGENERNFYVKLAKLLIYKTRATSSVKENISMVNELFDSAFQVIDKSIVMEQDLIPKEIESLSVDLYSDEKSIKQLYLEEIMQIVDSKYYRSIKLPIRDGTIIRDLLPFFGRLQVEIEDDIYSKRINSSINSGITVSIISPPGVGKTSFIARKLSKRLGILITCANSEANEMVPDRAAWNLDDRFRKILKNSIIHAYGTSRQLVQCIIIANLLSLGNLLGIWKRCSLSKEFEFDTFDTKLEFVSFNQSTRSYDLSGEIFDVLLAKKWDLSPIDKLRSHACELIVELMKDEPQDTFIIAIDDCNLFSLDKTMILSSRGTPRDLLSLFTGEIDVIRSICHFQNVRITDLYCGTMFKAEVKDIIQSAIQKRDSITTKVVSYFYLDLLTFDQAWHMVDLVYDLEMFDVNKEELRHQLEHIFPMRRGIVGTVCSILPKLSFNLESAFFEAWEEFVYNVTNVVLETFTTKISEMYIDRRILLEFYFKPKYPILYPYVCCDGSTASNLIDSGLAAPEFVDEGDNFYFYSGDPLSTKIAERLLTINIPNEEIGEKDIQYSNILKCYLDNADVEWEDIASLAMMAHCGKTLVFNPFFTKCYYDEQVYGSELNTNVVNMCFSPKSIKSSAEFYHSLKDAEWAKRALGKEMVDNQSKGDYLYFYCLEHGMNEFIDRVWLKPSKLNNADRIYIDLSRNFVILTSYAFHESNDVSNVRQLYRKGQRSLDYKLFYHSNYETSNPRLSCNWWASLTKTHKFFKDAETDNSLIKMLIHFHTSSSFMKKYPFLPKEYTTKRISRNKKKSESSECLSYPEEQSEEPEEQFEEQCHDSKYFVLTYGEETLESIFQTPVIEKISTLLSLKQEKYFSEYL